MNASTCTENHGPTGLICCIVASMLCINHSIHSCIRFLLGFPFPIRSYHQNQILHWYFLHNPSCGILDTHHNQFPYCMCTCYFLSRGINFLPKFKAFFFQHFYIIFVWINSMDMDVCIVFMLIERYKIPPFPDCYPQ